MAWSRDNRSNLSTPIVLAMLHREGQFVCEDPIQLHYTNTAKVVRELLRYKLAEIVEQADGKTTIKPTQLFFQWKAERVGGRTKLGPYIWCRNRIIKRRALL